MAARVATVRAGTRRRTPAFNDAQQKVITRRIRQEIGRGREKHHYDVAQNNQDIINTGTLVNLSAVSQGDTDLTRTGDRLMPKALHIRVGVQAQAANNLFRIIVFRWNQSTDDVTPTLQHIVESTSYFLSPLNWDEVKAKTFTPLYDRTYWMPGTTKTDKSWRSFLISLYPKRFGKRPIQFDNTSTSGSGHFYALFYSDQSTSGGPIVHYYSRLTFTDS